MEKNLTSGSVLKNIVYFSLPFLLAYFLQVLYGLADLFIIGQFDTVASITAVSIGSQVMHMLTVMIVGLTMGSTVCIAQAVGADNKKQISQTIGNTAILFVAVSIFATVALAFFVDPLVAIMYTPQESVSGTASYLFICFLGIPFITAYNVISAIYRGLGDSKSPMYFVAVACVINIVLDYIFIGAMHLGPIGAALGTTLSQAVSVIFALVMFTRKKNILPGKEDFQISRFIMGKLLRIGLPVSLQDGFVQIAFIAITIIANRRGLNDAAAVGIVEKIIGFLFLVPSSLLSSVSALCAQNIGAQKPERAIQTLRYAIYMAAGFGLMVSIITQFVSEPVVNLFTSDRTVIVMGGEYLRGYIWDCMLAGIHFCFSGYFCACGRSELSFMHNMITLFFARIPGVYLASAMYPHTLFPMGLVTAAGSLVSVIICLIAFAWLQRQSKNNL
ncbi:MAG: MATE family efflux transporter [Candidatus Bruticola sp.]